MFRNQRKLIRTEVWQLLLISCTEANIQKDISSGCFLFCLVFWVKSFQNYGLLRYHYSGYFNNFQRASQVLALLFIEIVMVNLHLSSSISFIAPQYNSLTIYCGAPEHFLMLIRILHQHSEDKKYLRGHLLPGKGKKTPTHVQVPEKASIPVKIPLPSPSSATLSSPFSIKVLRGLLAKAADVTLARSCRHAWSKMIGHNYRL